MHASAISLLAIIAAPFTQALLIPPTYCNSGTQATTNGLFSINCQYAANNISDAINSAQLPSFGQCLSGCDANLMCKAVTYFPNGQNGEGRCLQFMRFNNSTNFRSTGAVIPGNGAVAKCKNGPYFEVGGKSFNSRCSAAPGNPIGLIASSREENYVLCMTRCAWTPGCTTAEYFQGSGSCGLWRQPGNTIRSSSTSDNSFAVLV